MPSAAASSPLRGPRKLAAIKQVGSGGHGPHSLSGDSGIEEGVPRYFHFYRERRGGLGLPPLRGKMILPRTPTILSKHHLDCWRPDTSPCLTTGPDPASPGDWPLPSAGETTDPLTSDSHLLPTPSADIDLSIPRHVLAGHPGTQAQTQLHLMLRAPASLASWPQLLSEKLLLRPPSPLGPEQGDHQDGHPSRILLLISLSLSFGNKHQILAPPLASRKGLKPLPSTPPAPACQDTGALPHILPCCISSPDIYKYKFMYV